MKLIADLDENIILKTIKEFAKRYNVPMSKQRCQQALEDFYKLFNNLSPEMQKEVEIGIISHTFVTKTFNSESSTLAQVAFFVSKANEIGAKIECKFGGEIHINGQKLKLSYHEEGFVKLGEEEIRSFKDIEKMITEEEEELPNIDDDYYMD